MKRLPVLFCLIVAGCAAGKSSTTKSSAANLPQRKQMGSFFTGETAAKEHSMDPQGDPKLFVQLTVYKLTVPARTVSHNEEFWKHVDEASMDVAQHDLLFANGFRVGVAPRGDWDYFKALLERDSVTSQATGGSGIGGSTIEMPLREAVPQQTVMYIHPTKGLIGQSYDQCDELMNVHFEPVPRRTGDVRISAVPMFRSARTEITYTARNEPIPHLFDHKDYLFDLKLDVDVPLDNFLVISPSSDADREVSLGHKLLCLQFRGKQYETVLVLSPQPFQFEAPTTQPKQTAEAVGK